MLVILHGPKFYIISVSEKWKIFYQQELVRLIDWLIDWGLTPFSTIFQSYHDCHFTYSYVSWLSYTSTQHNRSSKQQAAFPHRLLAHWWKATDACHSDFCQTTERMLAELGFELKSPGLTACVVTNWAGKPSLKKKTVIQ